MAGAAASLAATPIAINAATADRASAPVAGESELGGSGIGATVIIAALAAAGMIALLVTDDDDDEDFPVSP